MTQIVLAAVAVLLLIYDVIIGLWAGREATISCVLHDAAQHHPIIAVAIGIVVGHCLWRAK